MILFLLFCCVFSSSGPPKIQGSISCSLALINSPHLYLLKAEQSEKNERTGGFWLNKDQMGVDEISREGTKGQASGREGMWARECWVLMGSFHA